MKIEKYRDVQDLQNNLIKAMDAMHSSLHAYALVLEAFDSKAAPTSLIYFKELMTGLSKIMGQIPEKVGNPLSELGKLTKQLEPLVASKAK